MLLQVVIRDLIKHIGPTNNRFYILQNEFQNGADPYYR